MNKNLEYQRQWRKDNSEKIKKYNKENIEKRKEYHKEWLENNPEYMEEYQKQWYKNNSEKVKRNVEKWQENNPEKVKRYKEQWRKENSEYGKQWMNLKYKTDLKFILNAKMKSMIYKSLKGNKAGKYWESLVGYKLIDLIKHLKKTIPKGCIWQDYLNGKLQIDHIIPISAFNFTKVEHPDFKRCWSLDNLRLLPAKENMIKGSKLSKLFQPALKLNIGGY